MMTYQELRNDIGALCADLANRDVKYRRNFNRYNSNGRRNESVYNPRGAPLSYYSGDSEADVGVVPVINVIKSSIDTHISKLSQTKVRPYFNSINGSFRTRCVVRNAQIYFDEIYNTQNIYKSAIEAARDAELFECGHLWVDDETLKVKRIRPWEYFYDRAEFQNDECSRVMLFFRAYPMHLLQAKIKGTKEEAALHDRMTSCQYIVYYDLKEKRKYELVNDTIVTDKKIHFDTNPVATIYYSSPIKGGYSTSLADDIYTIQTTIDMLSHRIHVAASLNPANTIFVPKSAGGGSSADIKPSMINNEIGNVYAYEPNLAGGSPIMVSTPAPISPMYHNLLEYFEQKAYNLAGISQLSAQSKKPSGLNSGVALQTLEDVESERHNVILQNYIHFLMTIANILIDVAPDNNTILPERVGIGKLKWSDIRAQRHQMSLQFAAASALSKDPKTKMEQIEKMLAMNLIDKALVSTMMEIPDLERAYSLETASLDVCERIIERAIEDDVYDFYETADIQQLYKLTTYYINKLDSIDEPRVTLDRLVLLLKAVKGKMNAINTSIVNSNIEQQQVAESVAQAVTGA